MCDSTVVQALIQSGKANIKSELGLKGNPNSIATLGFEIHFAQHCCIKTSTPRIHIKNGKYQNCRCPFHFSLGFLLPFKYQDPNFDVCNL